MRIITGSAKGVKLKTVGGLDVRPTADRVKESIFNILENINIYPDTAGCNKIHQVINQAKVLDLFAGTGNLGLEALSRGAGFAVFIDKNQASLAAIRQNIQIAKLAERCEIIKSDAFSALDRLVKANRSFNLVFIDPPYDKGLAFMAIAKIDKSNILEQRGILVVEHSREEAIDSKWQNLKIFRSQRYGQTLVSFLTPNI